MVSACLGTVHPDKSSCWETDEIPDGFCNQAQGNYTDEPEPNTLPLPGQPLASIRYFLGEFSPCFKLGCSGPSLPNCRRICSLSFMLSCRFPGAAIASSGLCEQEGWAGFLPAPGRSGGRTSPGVGSPTRELGSLSNHLGRLFAELMHITELGVWAEEGRGERVV